MKFTKLSKQQFEALSQLDRIEFMLKNTYVSSRIYKFLPTREILALGCLFIVQRMFTLLIIAAFGLSQQSIYLSNQISIIFNAAIALIAIIAIIKFYIFYKNHKLISNLNEEFIDKFQLAHKKK